MIFTKKGVRYMIDRWGYVLRLRSNDSDWEDEWLFYMGGPAAAKWIGELA